MPRSYCIDPKRVFLESMRNSLASRRLIPSRRPLQERLEERFEILARAGLRTVAELLECLKNNNALERFRDETGLPQDYLVLLKREAKSYFPNPVPLRRFPNVSEALVQRLETEGIKHSRQLFERVEIIGEMLPLDEIVGDEKEEFLRLVRLSDLSRLYGVGPVFADLLLHAGIDSVETFVSYEAAEIVALYEERTGKKADFTKEDIRFSLELARHLISMKTP